MKLTFAWPRELAAAGVLGMNRRNLQFILPENPRSLYRRVDDKVRTKETCQRHGIPVPRTYGVLERYGQLDEFWSIVAGLNEFVIKPARGTGGRGVYVVTGRDGCDLRCADGSTVTARELRYHLASILSGLYSLGGRDDRAIVEERIDRHRIFSSVAVAGTPDIRLLVYRHRLAMAMLRLPTIESQGRANLHQGAVGAGIDLDNGTTIGGVCHDEAISVHPDTGASVVGLVIPAWTNICTVALQLSHALELGYVGIDIVLSQDARPIVLEANARPGLAIQIANRRGLLHSLDHH